MNAEGSANKGVSDQRTSVEIINFASLRNFAVEKMARKLKNINSPIVISTIAVINC
jgi:hypothetical protein